jgi:hypothetical protein
MQVRGRPQVKLYLWLILWNYCHYHDLMEYTGSLF